MKNLTINHKTMRSAPASPPRVRSPSPTARRRLRSPSPAGHTKTPSRPPKVGNVSKNGEALKRTVKPVTVPEGALKVVYCNTKHDLGKKHFVEFVDTVLGKKTFYLFVHAPWCGHCTQMKPNIKQALDDLKDKQHNPVINVSDTVMGHLTNQHKQHLLTSLLRDTVKGFPTLVRVGAIDKTNTIRVKFFDQDRSSQNIKKFLVDK